MKHIDKFYHFIAGAVIFWVASFFMSYAIISVVIIALLKEIYDQVIKHSYADTWDVLATIAGGIVIWVVI